MNQTATNTNLFEILDAIIKRSEENPTITVEEVLKAFGVDKEIAVSEDDRAMCELEKSGHLDESV